MLRLDQYATFRKISKMLTDDSWYEDLGWGVSQLRFLDSPEIQGNSETQQTTLTLADDMPTHRFEALSDDDDEPPRPDVADTSIGMSSSPHSCKRAGATKFNRIIPSRYHASFAFLSSDVRLRGCKGSYYYLYYY